jgi:hypothetical protein
MREAESVIGNANRVLGTESRLGDVTESTLDYVRRVEAEWDECAEKGLMPYDDLSPDLTATRAPSWENDA